MENQKLEIVDKEYTFYVDKNCLDVSFYLIFSKKHFYKFKELILKVLEPSNKSTGGSK